MDSPRRREPSPNRSGPSLLLLPVALLVGAIVGLATLGVHQDAFRPPSSPTSSHSAGFRHPYDVHPAIQYFGSIARHVHL